MTVQALATCIYVGTEFDAEDDETGGFQLSNASGSDSISSLKENATEIHVDKVFNNSSKVH